MIINISPLSVNITVGYAYLVIHINSWGDFMSKNAVSWLVAGVFAYAWYYVGHHSYFSGGEQGISDLYWFVTIATVALMRA